MKTQALSALERTARLQVIPAREPFLSPVRSSFRRVKQRVARLAISSSDVLDQQLLERLHQGDQEAATAIYARYADRLLALAERKTGTELRTRFDAEDVVQSVFRTFFRRAALGAYVVPEGDELWKLFLVIALNKIRRLGAHHRTDKRDVKKTESLFDSPAGGRLQPMSEDSLRVLQLTVDELLSKSPEHVRAMVRLRIEGRDVAEIAELTSRSKRSVERALQNFRALLSQQLADISDKEDELE